MTTLSVRVPAHSIEEETCAKDLSAPGFRFFSIPANTSADAHGCRVNATIVIKSDRIKKKAKIFYLSTLFKLGLSDLGQEGQV